MAKEPYKNLVDMFQRSVKDYADRDLFGKKQGDGWVWMKYKEFGAECNAFRSGLKQLGFSAGDRIALISNNRPEWAMAAYAAHGLRGAVVPMYEAQNDKEWKYILNDSGARVVIAATEAIAKKILEFKPELKNLEHVICLLPTSVTKTWAEVSEAGKKAPSEADQPTLDDISNILYTSGTTGNPKGVILTHGNIISNVNAIHEIIPMRQQDRSLSFLPWAHAFGQTAELHTMISLGAAMAIVDSVDKITQYMGEVKPTVLISVPRIFNRIYQGLQARMEEQGGLTKTLFYAGLENETKRRDLQAKGKTSLLVELKHKFYDGIVFEKVRLRFGGQLKYAISGGAAISREVAEFIDKLGIMVFEGYGLTETSPVATTNAPNARRIGSVGKALGGVRIVIDKEASGDPVQGEIVIHGPNVMKGYYNQEEETKKVFTTDGGFRTGDLGYLDDDGFLFITGRIKEQYKLENGKYVAPAPLEEQLKISPYILNAMIYGDNKLYNVALVVVNADAVKKWGAEHSKTLPSGQALLDNADVKKLLTDEIERTTGDYKSFEKVKKFLLIDEDFTTSNGMLTPKMSLKRRVIIDKYKAALDTLYSSLSEFYLSAWHHPGFAWIGNALLALLFFRVVPKELRRFTAIALVAIVLDAFFTGAFSPFKTGQPAQWLSIAFVIAGDLRYFYLVERDRDTASPLIIATVLAFVVPVTQTVIMEWIYPAPFAADRRLIFLSYEALFVLFSTLMWVWRHQKGANRWRYGLFAYVLVQYVLWASIDVLIVTGHAWGTGLRLIPNALYYAGFLWFVVLSWRR